MTSGADRDTRVFAPYGVWADLVGQDHITTDLIQAALGRGMTHAWLLTGPPGSGRSTAARAFAAALQCTTPGEPGCGHCLGCRTVLDGTHPDVLQLATDQLSIGVADTRGLVRRSSMTPSSGRWQVLLIEDADRLTEAAGNVLLKAVEEPSPRTVWILCAPGRDDMLPTIRSRCRHLLLRTPPSSAVAEILVRRDGVDPIRAREAARAAQGHIGRAKRLATDDEARAKRAEVLALPSSLTDIGSALAAAQKLVDATISEAKRTAEDRDAHETADMRLALGYQEGSRRAIPGAAGALKDLETRQKKRGTRMQRDALDLALVDLAAFYRDVLAVQLGALGGPNGDVTEPIHDDQYAAVRKIAAASTPETTLRRIEAVLECRKAVERNVAPLLAVEAMAVSLR
ncbi:MAG: DNA polymerase III subunit delta' [Catenulisporales bacterium]|nr:DNA polymerase III subunit delta' [Catenulisporales bacterium]